MLPHERRDDILHLIEQDGHVEVHDLVRRYGVSVDSIRKDLQRLSKEGRCRRVYGGAVRIERSSFVDERPYFLDAPAPEQDDDALGRLAVAHRAYVEIDDGDTVFLDVSRTNVLLARLIANGGKRVVLTTNMIDVLREVSDHANVTALGTGGYLNDDLNGFIGSATVSLIEPLLFNKAFVGASGIDVDRCSVMAHSFDDGAVKSRVVQNASYKFLMANAGKFERGGMYRFASITDFSAIITDTRDPSILEKLQRYGIPALQAARPET